MRRSLVLLAALATTAAGAPENPAALVDRHLAAYNAHAIDDFMALFWGAVIVGIILLVRHFGRGGQQTPSPPPSQLASPEQLLAERFARGEIDEEEYRRRMTVVRHGAST